MRYHHGAAAGRAGLFNPAAIALCDISKKSDKDLDGILIDPTASYAEKVEAFLEMSKRRKKRPQPAVLAAVFSSTVH